MNQPMTIENRISDRGTDVSAPLAGVTAGSLEFRRGASRLTLRSRSDMEDLFRAHFEGLVPEVDVDGGTVSIRYGRLSPAGWARSALLMAGHGADITLNQSVPWHLELRSGVSWLDADLEDLELTGFEIKGGASHVDLVLGQPRDIVPIRVHGGVSDVTVWRPTGVAVRASVWGGVSRLALDDQRFGAVGGQMRLATCGWAQATSGYDIDIRGGASHLTIEAR